MSGPVTAADVDGPDSVVAAGSVEITASRESTVGAFRVRRALPRRTRRTIGAWCFVDHMGPASITRDRGPAVAPHPHIGLQTVTWLFAGEALHRDSLGTEQVIVPGQLNLMTAGRGVAHSEEGTARYDGDLHGVQLWVAQPERTRHDPPGFEHHPELPRLDFGATTATVLVGALERTASPARRDTDHLGVDLVVRPGTTTVPLEPQFEHGVVVFDGAALLDGQHIVSPGHLAYLGAGRDELAIDAREPTRALLIGGTPFNESVVMWWNYVARSRDEIVEAHRQWTDREDRFGSVASPLPPVDVSGPPWRTAGG